MKRCSIVLSCTLLSAATCLALATTAGADGLPIPGVTTDPSGLVSPGGDFRYATFARRDATVVTKTEVTGGVTDRSSWLRGRYTIPAVALDGSPSGLSGDGSKLAVIEPRRTFPQSQTHLALLDAERLQLIRRIDLNGDFSFDAISPNGARIYLIHYMDGRDPTDYEVRAYDTRSGRLVHGAVVDPDEPDEVMTGYPMSRAASPNGRWAYTLYGGNGHPFVHALDTRKGRAVCVDLPSDAMQGDIYSFNLGLDPGGSTLTIENRGDALLQVDTRSFDVSAPAPADPAAEQSQSPDGGPPGWLFLAGGAFLIGALALAGRILIRRRRAAGPEPDWASLAGADGGEPGPGEDGDVASRRDAANGALEPEAGAAGAGERGQERVAP